MVKMIRQKVGLILAIPALPIIAFSAIVMGKHDDCFAISSLLSAWLEEWRSVDRGE